MWSQGSMISPFLHEGTVLHCFKMKVLHMHFPQFTRSMKGNKHMDNFTRALEVFFLWGVGGGGKLSNSRPPDPPFDIYKPCRCLHWEFTMGVHQRSIMTSIQLGIHLGSTTSGPTGHIFVHIIMYSSYLLEN